ncbi:MAG: rod shape-determining protein RodA [Candidatus Omnitrophica bacterium]|nr:rod shape-determining protein RodA [Candidatus Omnitrophota bacterium]
MQRELDKKIWFCTLMIMGIGLVVLFSATYDNVRVTQKIFYDQVYCALLGIILMYIFGKVDYRRFYDVAYVIYFLNVLLLLWVMFSGRHALGARRWLQVGGISFQPSEVAKLALILVLGRYFSNLKPMLSFGLFSKLSAVIRQLVIPLCITGVLMMFILKQPDLGTALMFLGIFTAMVFVSGLDYKVFFSFIVLCIIFAPFGWHFIKQYQKDRILVFLNPNIDPLGAGYTIIQSKIAIGSGQIFGKGWLAGTQNQLNFLPERHTDFIFSVVGEEWGLLGTLSILCLYFILIMVSLQIACQVKDRFGTLVSVGIVSILTLQVVINMGMVMGLFPIVGIPLPFLSYGRTSFLNFAIMMGFLLNLSKKRTMF